MFNSTFFKFLITFALIIGASFLIMGIAGCFDFEAGVKDDVQQTVLK